MPDRDAHSHPIRGEAPHEPPAEEPSAAEQADRGHGIPAGMLDKVDPSTNKMIAPRCHAGPFSDTKSAPSTTVSNGVSKVKLSGEAFLVKPSSSSHPCA